MKSLVILIFSIIFLPSTILAEPFSDEKFELYKETKNDTKKSNWYFQARTQSSGTPNQVGIGIFRPLHLKTNSLSFFDFQINSEFGDFDGAKWSYLVDKLFDGSSILNTEVASFGFNTSTKVGKRWKSNQGSSIYGLNIGYETRLMKTAAADNAIVYNPSQAFFSQLSFELEARNERWSVNPYSLIPITEEDKPLNDTYIGSPITTSGIDLGLNINKNWNTIIGFYFQELDLYLREEIGFKGRISYTKPKNYNIGVNISHDNTFDTRVSADIKYSFNNAAKRKKGLNNRLLKSPNNRNIRVHDCGLNNLRNSRKWMKCKKI